MTGILDATISQLRAYCPPFGGRVAGAADFTQGLENYNANMMPPAAYVVPLDQDSDGNRNMTGLFQFVRKTVGIVVELDAQPDLRGQAPAMTYDDIEAALFAAILNWRPVECRVPNSQGYWFAAGRFLDLDRKRLFYRWDFSIDYQITEEDGWHAPDPPITLNTIEIDEYTAPPFDMPPPDGRDPAIVEKLNMQPTETPP
jgi:hypothetical protein